MAWVSGRPFLEWVVAHLAAQGIGNVTISTGYLAETVERHFRRRPVKEVCVRCVAEPKPLGTGGGFLNAVRATPEKPAAWLVLNGDSLALASLDALFSCLSDSAVDGAILGVPMTDASRYGTIEQSPASDLIGFREKKPGPGTINAGVYLLRASLIESFSDRVPLSFETEIFRKLLPGARA